MYIYICVYMCIKLIEIMKLSKTYKFATYAMNDDFQVILKLSQNSNTLILHKV